MGQHFLYVWVKYQQRDIRLFFEQNSHQLGVVAHRVYLCFQARRSDESPLTPHHRLSGINKNTSDGKLASMHAYAGVTTRQRKLIAVAVLETSSLADGCR